MDRGWKADRLERSQPDREEIEPATSLADGADRCTAAPPLKMAKTIWSSTAVAADACETTYRKGTTQLELLPC